jgi:hypothetical protein
MDAAVVFLAGTKLQIAADAGSLAGAAKVREGSDVARAAAHDIAFENKAAGFPVDLELNMANLPAGDIVIGRYHRFADQYCESPPCFFPGSTVPNAVRVRAKPDTGLGDQVPLVFGAVPAFNVQGVNVTRRATAIRVGSTGAGILTLCPEGTPPACAPECDAGLMLNGDVTVDVHPADGWDGDTSIQINSDVECSLDVDGTAQIIAPETNMVGDYCVSGRSGELDTYLNPDSPPMPDPLADLPAPPIGIHRGSIRDTGTYLPGYYIGGLEIGSQEKVTLQPGIYVLDGDLNARNPTGGLQVDSQATLVARDVLLYIKGGKVDIHAGATVTITPIPDTANLYWGVAIFQARDNCNKAIIIGTANSILDGTFYFPSALVQVQGGAAAFGNQLIAYQLQVGGNGVFTIEYDGRFPAPGAKVFLVE